MNSKSIFLIKLSLQIGYDNRYFRIDCRINTTYKRRFSQNGFGLRITFSNVQLICNFPAIACINN